MTEVIIKRSYNFPPKLLDEWEKFHKPSKDYSPSAAGAFLIWMILPPDVREQARQLAHESNLKKAQETIKQVLSESLASDIINQWLVGNTPAARKAMLGAAKALEEKLSGKK